jgi:hypothetical protein
MTVGSGAAPRFPGDPGEGNFYIGWAEGSVQQTDISGNPLANFAAGAYWADRPLGIQHHYNPTGGISTGDFDSAINNDCLASLTFKLDTFTPAQISAGNADATLTTSANACIARAPWPAWLCYFHEPEDNFTTTQAKTDYRAATRYIVQFFRDAGVTNVAWLPIYMNPWTFDAASGRDWRTWHADWNGGTTNTAADWHVDKMMDIFGFDSYTADIGGTLYRDWATGTIAPLISDLTTNGFIAAYGTPPFVVCEFGMAAATNPYPNWTSDFAPDVIAWATGGDAVGIVYWNKAVSDPGNYDFIPAEDPNGTKLTAWRQICDAATAFTPP